MLFLFQTGAIKSEFRKKVLTQPCGKFLFQTGAIKREWCERHSRHRPKFLFQTGAIKRAWRVQHCAECFVSIPNWCD